MEFIVLSRAYNQFGHSDIYSPIGDLLSLELGSYGSAVERVELVFYLRSACRVPITTFETSFEEHHAYLERLPMITFRRKLKRFIFNVSSQQFTAEDECRHTRSAAKINAAMGDVASALGLIKKRVKPADAFAVDQFLADVNGVLACGHESLDAWDLVSQRADENRLAIRASKSPWELLEVDWRKFHPQARQVLDSPFFWEEANDLAPHGNDTGSDLLSEFRRWNKKHSSTSPLDFLNRLMATWEIEPINWKIDDARSVHQLENEHPIAIAVSNQAAIALVFAVLKVRGTCPPDVSQIGLAALRRTKIAVHAGGLDAEAKQAWDAAIGEMLGKLESLARPAV